MLRSVKDENERSVKDENERSLETINEETEMKGETH